MRVTGGADTPNVELGFSRVITARTRAMSGGTAFSDTARLAGWPPSPGCSRTPGPVG